MDDTIQVIKTYTTRSVEKKLIGDDMKASKFATVKRREKKKVILVDENNLEVVKIGE